MNTRSAMRDSSKGEIRDVFIEAGEKLSEGIRHILENKEPVKSCINCINFDEPTEICKKFNQRPPARVIALSCEHYEDNDEIPF